MKKCYCCGAVVPDKSKFCPKCGKPLEITQDLIDRARAENSDAQTELYERTYQAVYSRIRAKVPDEDTAMDIMQETYLRAFTNLDQLQSSSAFMSWLFSIAHSQTSNWYRKNGKEQENVQMSQLEYENDDTIPDEDDLLDEPEYRADFSPDESLDRAETGRLLSEILDTLPEDQRMILTMRYYDEMSLNEISEELGVNLNTVKSRLSSGKKKVEAKVLELEKSGTKLYSLGPVAFLVFLLHHSELFAPAVPANTIVALTAAGTGAAASGGTAAVSAAAKASAGVVEKASNPVGVKAASRNEGVHKMSEGNSGSGFSGQDSPAGESSRIEGPGADRSPAGQVSENAAGDNAETASGADPGSGGIESSAQETPADSGSQTTGQNTGSVGADNHAEGLTDSNGANAGDLTGESQSLDSGAAGTGPEEVPDDPADTTALDTEGPAEEEIDPDTGDHADIAESDGRDSDVGSFQDEGNRDEPEGQDQISEETDAEDAADLGNTENTAEAGDAAFAAGPSEGSSAGTAAGETVKKAAGSAAKGIGKRAAIVAAAAVVAGGGITAGITLSGNDSDTLDVEPTVSEEVSETVEKAEATDEYVENEDVSEDPDYIETEDEDSTVSSEDMNNPDDTAGETEDSGTGGVGDTAEDAGTEEQADSTEQDDTVGQGEAVASDNVNETENNDSGAGTETLSVRSPEETVKQFELAMNNSDSDSIRDCYGEGLWNLVGSLAYAESRLFSDYQLQIESIDYTSETTCHIIISETHNTPNLDGSVSPASGKIDSHMELQGDKWVFLD